MEHLPTDKLLHYGFLFLSNEKIFNTLETSYSTILPQSNKAG
jgi:hypothetical protein